ncbi:copia protein [Tanacetum coccineum]
MLGDTPFDMGFKNDIGMGHNRIFDQKLVAAICSEVMKMFKGKGVADGSPANANQASSSMHYAVILPHRDNLEPRGLKCVLLGYLLNSKGYNLYDLNTKQVFHSRDVVFEEKVFPFKAQLVSSSDKAEVFPTFCSFDESDAVPLTNENIEP